MVKQYQKCLYVDAIQFQSTDAAHIDEIIDFVGMPISIDYTGDGVKLRVIRAAYDVLVAFVGDYIVKDSNGKLFAKKQTDFEAEYVEVTSP